MKPATVSNRVPPPQPCGPVPSAAQLQWHALEYYAFLHFTVNTYTDQEWGFGDEDPAIFNPTEFDARLLAGIVRDAGMRGLIVTAKHHDGFCLWPSDHTRHSVRFSPYRQGKGDIVGELAAACEALDLRFGVYLSPWDRNHPEYGREAYNQYYRAQLTELLTRYGPVFEVWFDGANGGDGYYGGAREERRIDRSSYYRWPEVQALVRQLQPDAIMFSDAGPDCRWVGNEDGHGAATNWAGLRLQGMHPGGNYGSRLTTGDADGTHWVPAEVDVSIRPGWFYHAAEDDRVKTVDHLLDIYHSSIGNGCNLLLNVPPDRRGCIHEIDADRLLAFRRERERLFRADLARAASAHTDQVRGKDPAYAAAHLVDGRADTYWATDDGTNAATVELEWPRIQTIERLRLEECIELGQRVEAFAVDAMSGGVWRRIGAGTTIGPRRILSMKTVQTDRVRLRLTASRACPVLRRLSLYGPDATPV